MSFTAVKTIEVIRNNFIKAYEYQIYPLNLLTDDLVLDRESIQSQLFYVVLIFQKAGTTSDNQSSL